MKRVTCLALISFSILLLSGAPGTAKSGRSAQVSKAAKYRVAKAYGKLPLSFEANRGQTDGKVKFLSRGRGYTLFLTPTEAVLSLSKPKSKTGPARSESHRAVVRMQLVGANPNPEILGVNKLRGKSNYFIGNDSRKWRTGINAGFRQSHLWLGQIPTPFTQSSLA